MARRKNRKDCPGIMHRMDEDDMYLGSFNDLFDGAEPLLPHEDDYEDEIVPMSAHLTDEMIDVALDSAEKTLRALDKLEASLWDRNADGCTCTVVPYSGRLSEQVPAEIDLRFMRTAAEICNHCLSELTKGGE